MQWRCVLSKVEDGIATFDASALVGAIGLSLVRASGTVPLGCFVCVPTSQGARLYQDASDVLTRLARVERDISDAYAIHRAMEAKYEDIVDRLNKLFTGYNF